MTNNEKPDAEEIRTFLRELRTASWLMPNSVTGRTIYFM